MAFSPNLLEVILINSKLKVDQKLLSCDRFRSPLLIASFILASLLMPMFQLVNSNIKDLGIQYIDGVLISFLVSLIVFIFSSIFVWQPFQKVFLLLSVTLVVSSFFNTFFLPNNLSVSDGTDGLLLDTRVVAGYVVFLVLILLVFPVYFNGKVFVKIKETLLFSAKLLVVLSILLTSYQVAFLPKKSSSLLKSCLTDKTGIITLGQKNIFILSFDQVQGSAFNGFIKSEDGKAFRNILSGFDFFPNAVTSYPNTHYSLIGFFRTRAVNDNTEKLKPEDNFLRKSLIKGIKSKIFMPAQSLNFSADYSQSKENPSLLYSYALNNAFGFNINQLNILKNHQYSFNKYKWKFDSWLLEKLPDHIVYDETLPGNIIFIHFLFSHQPFMINDSGQLYDQNTLHQKQNISGFIDTVNFVSTRTSKVIEKLKKIGAYDNTAIFLMSDHGFEDNINSRKNIQENPDYFHGNDDFLSKDNIKPLGTYNPLIMFKDFSSHHNFKIKDNIVSLIDIGVTVCDIMQCRVSNDSAGVSLKRLDNSQRLHDFWIYHGGSAERFAEGYDRFHTFKPKHWSRYKAASLHELREILIFEMYPAMVSDFLFSFSSDDVVNIGLSGKEPWGRWSDGSQAEIKFQIEPDCNAKFVTFNLKAFITRKNPEQRASVFINDKSVGEIRISAGEAQPKQFIFALPDAQDNKYTIRFEIDIPTTPKSVGVGAGKRKFGFGFIDMKLSPDDVAAQ